MMDAAPPETDGAAPVLDRSFPADAFEPRDASMPVDGGAPDLGPPATYFGQVLYEDRLQDMSGFTGEVVPRGASGVRVELLDAAGAVLEETRADIAGRFRFATDAGGVSLRAWADTAVGDHRVLVTDRRRRANAYAIETAALEGAETTLLATAAELGGPFNVVATSHAALTLYAPFVGAAGPALIFRWEAGSGFACGSCFDGVDEISLGGGLDDTDEYDDVIILHELAHYFVEHYSADSSPGGAHRDRQVEPTLAYGEGVAYAFACIVGQSPWIIDTFATSVRSIDLEAVTVNGVATPDLVGTTDGTATGNLREEIVAGILWDAYDEADAAEPFDRVALGVDGVLALLVDHFGAPSVPDAGARGIDLTDLLDALVCFSGVPADDVAALAADRDFPWSAPGC